MNLNLKKSFNAGGTRLSQKESKEDLNCHPAKEICKRK